MAHRSLPSDVSSDIHQIIAKALYLRLVVDRQPLIISRAEIEAAADAQFEYDLSVDGDLLFRPAADA